MKILFTLIVLFLSLVPTRTLSQTSLTTICPPYIAPPNVTLSVVNFTPGTKTAFLVIDTEKGETNVPPFGTFQLAFSENVRILSASVVDGAAHFTLPIPKGVIAKEFHAQAAELLTNPRRGVISNLCSQTVIARPQFKLPAKGMLYWGHAVPSLAANYDLLTLGQRAKNDPEYALIAAEAARLKRTPAIFYTRDINDALSGVKGACPSCGCKNEFLITLLDGSHIPYGPNGCSLADTTAFSGKVNGLTYSEMVISDFANINWNTFGATGIGFDGMWYWVDWLSAFRDGKVDINRDGISDDKTLVHQTWLDSRIALLSEMKKVAPLDSDGVLVNIAVPTTMDARAPQHINGIVCEMAPSRFCKIDQNVITAFKAYEDHSRARGQRHVSFLNGHSGDTYGGQAVDPRNDLSLQSLFAAMSGITGAPSGFEPENTAHPNQHYGWWEHFGDLSIVSDHFYMDQGYRIYEENTVELAPKVYARKNTKGVSVANASGQPYFLTASYLRERLNLTNALYKFKSNSDPNFYDGAEFTSVTLPATGTRGSGLLLSFEEASPAYAPIIIDNMEISTTPTQTPLQIVNGQATGRCDTSSHPNFITSAFKVFMYPWCNTPQSAPNSPITWKFVAHTSPAGSGAKGIFEAAIRQDMEVDVYVWWGDAGAASSHNIPLTLTENNNTLLSLSIDQRVNSGKWNKLGRYLFLKGAKPKVIIDTVSAIGQSVQFDAVLFLPTESTFKVE